MPSGDVLMLKSLCDMATAVPWAANSSEDIEQTASSNNGIWSKDFDYSQFGLTASKRGGLGRQRDTPTKKLQIPKSWREAKKPKPKEKVTRQRKHTHLLVDLCPMKARPNLELALQSPEPLRSAR